MIPKTLTDKRVSSRLVDVLVLGIGHGKLQDSETVLGSLRALRPGMIELDALEAWICVQRSLWPEAVRLLRNLDARKDSWSLGKAFLAYALFFSGDPTWRVSANEVLETSSDTNAVALVQTMLHPDAPPLDQAPPDTGLALASAPHAEGADFHTYLRA